MGEHRFGKFVLERRIAEGGMGEVFLARQHGIADVQRSVVLKRVKPALRDSESFEKLFVAEARISARLNHPNVVQLYEFGRINDSYFLTFERVVGHNLSELRRRVDGGWPIDVVFEVASQILAGLTHVHRLMNFDGQPLGIVHRDISPANLMVSFDGTAKLLDFGVARSALNPVDTPGTIQGKYPYLSPEQTAGTPLDERSDVFSLGTVLWELATGRRAFARPTEAETMGAVAFFEPGAPSRVATHLPRIFDDIVQRAMAKERERRFPSAEHMALEIDQAATTLGLARGPRVLRRFIEDCEGGKVTPSPAPSPLAPTTINKANLLLVDDDDENLQALRRTFRNRFNLFPTTDPREALRILEDNVIHVVITDQRMPHLTGVELCARAAERHSSILKIITSALSDGPTLLDAINRGHIHRYIVKPWLPDDLRRTVDDLVRERGLSGADVIAARLEKEVSELSELTVQLQVASEQRPQRVRRLRPEMLRLMNEYKRIGVMLVQLAAPDAERLAKLGALLTPAPTEADLLIELSDEKLALLLVDRGDGNGAALGQKLARHERLVEATLREWGLPQAAIVTTRLPDDAATVDEALMKATTELVLRHRQGARP